MNNFLELPSTDFQRVRDGRNSLPLWLDIDLSVSRSILGTGANAALSLNIAGNSFYVDQDTLNVGNATVHFQDTNLGAASAPLFVSAGFIANVPFTQMLIENTAQPGKRLRIFYGVDIDFQAGINASISISGTVNIGNFQSIPANVVDAGFAYGASFKSNALLPSMAVEVIFLPSANTNGAILWDWQECHQSGTYGLGALIAKNGTPATIIDGDIICPDHLINVSVTYDSRIIRPVKIPAGKGLYYLAGNAHSSYSIRSALYTLLP